MLFLGHLKGFRVNGSKSNRKTILIPFQKCSISRAARFLSEILEQSVENQDVEDLIVEGVILACINLGTSVGNDENTESYMSLQASIGVEDEELKKKISQSELSDDVVSQIADELESNLKVFCDSYLVPLEDGEYFSGLFPLSWQVDEPLSKILLPEPEIGKGWNVERDGLDYMLFTIPIIPKGFWGLIPFSSDSFIDLFSVGVDSDEFDFCRLPNTNHRWLGSFKGKKICSEDIVIFASEVKKLIELKFKDQVDVVMISELDQVNEQMPHTKKSPARTVVKQSQMIASLIAADPKLREKVLAAKSWEEKLIRVNNHFTQSKLAPLNITPKTLQNWLGNHLGLEN